MRHLTSFTGCFVVSVLGLGLGLAYAQPPKPGNGATAATKREGNGGPNLRSPYERDRPEADKLSSPRETLKTLYFAVINYDKFPEMTQDAIACLDLPAQPRPSAEDAMMMALNLEYILQSLALPLNGVSNTGVNQFTVYDAGDIKLSMRKGDDGGWRFDQETLNRLPAMRRAVRGRANPASKKGLREGFTDPRATYRQFISDIAHGDYYAAARALDLSFLANDQRRQQGPLLAQELAFVMQRRGYMFRQELPDQPDAPPYTWHADHVGRIALDRVRQPDGKDAWLFTKQTSRAIPRMYEAAQSQSPDSRYVRLGFVVPAVQAGNGSAARARPEEVPAHLGSPRALLQGFFRTMNAADTNDARLVDALEYLDLRNVPDADRAALGGKLALKLQAVLRKLPIDLSSVPDDWNAPPQTLGESLGVKVEIVRTRDGCWCFSEGTVARIPDMFQHLAGKARDEEGPGVHLDSARDAMQSFEAAAHRHNFAQAARCLNLSDLPASAREELGPILAVKLQYVLDRIGRIYVEEIPDSAEAPRFILYRGELGRIILDRRAEDPDKGQWQFSPETVQNIEKMFRAVRGRQPEGADEALVLRFWDAPGPWLRMHLPEFLQSRAGALDLYQWPGLVLAALASWMAAWLTMAVASRAVAWLLRRSGSALTLPFVSSTLRPLTWLATVYVFFQLLEGLDLRVGVAGALFAAEKFLLAALLGWLGFRIMDLSMGIYTNAELFRPHRSLSDMIVPVSVRLGKAVLMLAVITYVVYEIGEIDLLGRFLTGLGVAGLAASLAAQDAMKSYFGTLLLIGERAFKIGDRITINNNQGVVEQVGFRSTRLRTKTGSLLTVPNSVIAAAAIENLGADVAAPADQTLPTDAPARRAA